MRYYCSRRTALKLLVGSVLLLLLYHALRYFIKATGLDRQIEPGALKGYPYCDVDSKAMENFPQKYPCSFDPPPNANGPIIVTFINSAWLPLAKNWVCSAKKVGLLSNVYLISLEKGVCSHFPDVKCHDTGLSVHGTSFGRAEYRKLVIERTRIILSLLSCGQTVALVDADVTFLQNPLKYLNNVLTNKDIVFQADSVGVRFVDAFLPWVFSYICGGFIYMRPNYATRRLWTSVLQYQEGFFWNDQAGLNVCIRHHTQSVQWQTLNSKLFPSGKQFFFYEEVSLKEALVIHANHLQGVDKEMHMVGYGVWCYEEHSNKLCHEHAVFRSHCKHSKELPKWCRLFAEKCSNLYGVNLT